MYIQKLILKNFKKHSYLELEFSSKLNILFGSNDAGKSCVIEGIKWLFFGGGKDIRKEGTKKTTAEVTLDNNVKITKIKSTSVNAYILNIPGQEEKRFDAVGKNIPDEVKEAMQTRTIEIDSEEIILNIANQISLPFLLSESPTYRSKLFNQLTGSNLIDKTLQSFNKDILKISRESKLELTHLEDQKTSLEEVTIQKDKLEELYGNFKTKVEELEKLQQKYNLFTELKDKIEKNSCDLQEVNYLLTEIKTVPDELLKEIREKIVNLEKYTELYTKASSNNKELEEVERELKDLKIVDIDTGGLKEKIERLEKMKEISVHRVENERVKKDLEVKIEEIGNNIIEGEKRYKDILKKYGKCPTCRSEITVDILKGIKL